MTISRRILVVTLVPLVLFTLAFSYLRFIHMRDYLVGYEAPCDPIYESCFVYCQDDTCEDSEYFLFVERLASAVHARCGESITDCEAAKMCPTGEVLCAVMYCNPEEEACDSVVPEPPPSPEDAAELKEDSGELSSEEDQVISP